MRHLFSVWNSIEIRFREARSKLFLFDFDGTLSAIKPHPAQATLNSQVRSWLLKLKNQEGVHVGIISGRSLRDIRKKVGVKKISYVGNHGLEMMFEKKHFIHPIALARSKLLVPIKKELHSKFHLINGLMIEDKGLSLSLHYRNVTDRIPFQFKKEIGNVMRHVNGGEYFRLFPGKKVIEVRPRIHWNKGLAVKKLRQLYPKNTKVMYVGDDVSDEDVFKSLSKIDCGIRVGKNRCSEAPFYLKSQTEINLLLQKLVRLCR